MDVTKPYICLGFGDLHGTKVQRTDREFSNDLAVLKTVFCFCFLTPPLPWGVRGKVRTVIFLCESAVLGRVREPNMFLHILVFSCERSWNARECFSNYAADPNVALDLLYSVLMRVLYGFNNKVLMGLLMDFIGV
jgi:hypothetical protein